MIFTFYSYKGGVGRSMALANVAELLYQNGNKVLIIDFDLEAPGLERFFDVPRAQYKPDEIIEQRGIIDLLRSYKEMRSLPILELEKDDDQAEEIENSGEEQETDDFPYPVEPISNFIVPIYEKQRYDEGELFIIPAGCRDKERFSEYAANVHSFNWEDFYDNYDGEKFFDWFRKEVNNFADIVFIDSRTGVTEMGGVCTYQLADVVVMLVAPNEQNIDGTLKIAKSLSNPELIKEGRDGRNLDLVIVPSRVDTGEEQLNIFQEQFNRKLAPFVSKKISFQKNIFVDLQIPYTSSYSYSEKVAIRDKDKASAKYLIEAFNVLTSAIFVLSQPEPIKFDQQSLSIIEVEVIDDVTIKPMITTSQSDHKFNQDQIVKVLYSTTKLFINTLRYIPLGMIGGVFISYLIQQEWVIVLTLFPGLIISFLWTGYSKGLLERLAEVYYERGSSDVDGLIRFQKKLDQAIKWQLAGTDDKYLKAQGNACREMKIAGFNQGTFTPLLSEVFVPLDLSSNFVRNFDGQDLPGKPGYKVEPELQRAYADNNLRIWDILKQVRTYPTYSRMAIVAWGGFGKTTLMRHIAYSYSQKKTIKGVPKLLPVLIYLRQWQEVMASDKPDLPTLIEKHHIPHLPEGKAFSLPPNWASNHLLKGNMLVMFDGFDEVKQEWRTELSTWIGQQMTAYPQSVFIVTSRPAGYKDFVNRARPSTKIWVKPFHEDQREKFIKQWYLTQEKYARAGQDTPEMRQEVAQRSSNLIEQLGNREELESLSQNPLLLNMIANLHRRYSGRRELSKRRTELYRDIYVLKLRDQPLDQGIRILVEHPDSQQILQKIAFAMVGENKTTKSKAELVEALGQELSRTEFKDVDAEQFLEQIVDVAELIVLRDEDYEFAHLSFQGYLAATEIKEQNQEQLLIDNWDKSWWKETILLYCAQTNPINVLNALIEIGTPEAANLARQCINESPRKIDPKIQFALEQGNITSQVENIVFQQLKEYLKTRDFKKADQETYRVMIRLVGKEEGDEFSLDDLKTFPKEELKQIDELWLKYGDGKFGFSVQKKIWLDLGGKLDHFDNDIYVKLCERLGWQKSLYRGKQILKNNGELTFNSNAPSGHLPKIRNLDQSNLLSLFRRI